MVAICQWLKGAKRKTGNERRVELKEKMNKAEAAERKTGNERGEKN